MSNLKSKTAIRLIRREDSSYPALLKEIPNPPSQIYCLGELPAEKIPRLAIVGTRKATATGRAMAKKIAQELGESGIIVVSGLAIGIDTASHEGALEARFKTMAVLGNGLDSIYPRQNENLARRILEGGGTIISEYPVGTPGFPNQFLERNRIISGLCLGVLIIEAPLESGALVTARLSAEQGREVFVFPGPVDHPNYKGSHQLIRDGARLVTSAADIFEDLNLEISKSPPLLSKQWERLKDENQLLIFQAIAEAGQPLNIDKIIAVTKLEPQTVNQAISFLTIGGIIKETERGYTL